MKKKLSKGIIVSLLAGTVFFASCIGSFSLTGKVLKWNRDKPKFVDELLFIVLNIVPVYSVSIFIDAVVLNSIEFWTGSNPVAFKEGEKRAIETETGTYIVEKQDNSYHIQKEGQEGSVDLIYDEETQACYLECEGERLQVK